jgi:hypothetical protein
LLIQILQPPDHGPVSDVVAGRAIGKGGLGKSPFTLRPSSLLSGCDRF